MMVMILLAIQTGVFLKREFSVVDSHFNRLPEYPWIIPHDFYISSVTWGSSLSARDFHTLMRLEAHRRLLFCTSSLFPRKAWSLESAHACPPSDVMPCDRLRPRWAPRAPPPLPTPTSSSPSTSLSPSPPCTKISLCRFSDARLRTQHLTTGAHWPNGGASPESASFWAAETKGWG